MTRISEYLPTRQNRAYNEAAGTLDSIVNRIIRDRRASGTSPGDDLLGVLIDARDADTDEGMSDKQLRDEVLTLLLSGHETTAVMLSWAFLMLSQAPAVPGTAAGRGRHAALASAAIRPGRRSIRNLEYTKRVVQEVARLKPPIWWVARTAIGDDTICGQPIKAGTTVLISQYLIHRNLERVEEDPETLRPRPLRAGARGPAFEIRLSAVRRRAAGLPRLGLCHHGNADGAGHAAAALRRQRHLESRPGDVEPHHPAAEIRHHGQGAATPASLAAIES